MKIEQGRSYCRFTHILYEIANEFQKICMEKLDDRNVSVSRIELPGIKNITIESDEYIVTCIVIKKGGAQ